MKLLITCPFWTSKLLWNEIKKLWLKMHDSFSTGTFVDSDMQGLYQINLWSRIANKVYIQIAEGAAHDFDQLFDLVKNSSYDQYSSNSNISIKVHSVKSKLYAQKSIQSISHKAILESIKAFGKSENYISELLIIIEQDQAKVYLNSSGKSLHQRGYRKEAGEAPLKENLAAALLLFSWWNFKKPLLDPFCGSGTICIEAALLARNIAPGLMRNFVFEQFRNFDQDGFKQLKESAQKQQFSGDYHITGQDSSSAILQIAKKNAELAGIAESVVFKQADFFETKLWGEGNSWIVTNPPYGKRIDSDEIGHLYQNLIESFQGEIFWGYISSYEALENNRPDWNKKKLYNGDEQCTFWYRAIS